MNPVFIDPPTPSRGMDAEDVERLLKPVEEAGGEWAVIGTFGSGSAPTSKWNAMKKLCPEYCAKFKRVGGKMDDAVKQKVVRDDPDRADHEYALWVKYVGPADNQ